MKMYMIAVHYRMPDKKNILGFRILDADTGEVKDYPYDTVKAVVQGNKAKIIGIAFDRRNNALKGSNGAFDRYPSLVNGRPINRSLVILNSIDNIGYQVSSFNGMIGHATRNEVVRFALKAGIANGKVVDKDGKKYVSAISGTYTNIPYEKSKLSEGKRAQLKRSDVAVAKQVKAEITKKKASSKPYSNTYVPKVVTGTIADNSLLHMVDEVTGLTVEQKMAYAMMALRRIRPFCYSVFTCLRRIETEDVKTMGVSLKSLYFNPYFVLKVPISDLLFILIHEIYHISMKHRIREQNRNHDLWNKACDYYVNAVIADEFDLTSLGDCVDARKEQTGTRYEISLPVDCLFNKRVSVDDDTPEKIYEELENIKQSMQQNQSDSSSGDQEQQEQGDQGEQEGQSGQSDDQQGEDFDDAFGDDEENTDDSFDGAFGDEDDDSSDGEGGEDDTELDDSEHSDDQFDDLDDLANGGGGGGSKGNRGKKNNKGKGQGQGQGGDENDDSDSDSDETSDGAYREDEEDGEGVEDGEEESKSASKSKRASSEEDNKNNKSGVGSQDEESEDRSEITGARFRGQEIPNTVENDMVDSPDERSESTDRLEQMANSLLKRAASMHRQSHGSFGGEAGDWIERYVEKVLAPKVKWTAILRNKLTLASQKVNTFASPDKRFRSRGMVLPGPKKLENDTLENVKICIDTSGSISPKDIGVALAQIDQMFKQFKAEAELLYWDTQIRAIYPFKNPQELVSKKPMGGGGTDANCIFEYFETTREYKIGKKKKPNLVIVFTDGYFGTVNMRYKKQYKDTIWVVQGNDNFEAPFGTKAPFKTD